MQYILVGFTHDVGFRVFAFEGIAEHSVRAVYNVRADLALVRKYGIRVQELPLLCRAILEEREVSDAHHTFTFTEAAMSQRAEARAAEAATPRKKPQPPRPPGPNLGDAGRPWWTRDIPAKS